jgi:hypothetical protein
MRPRGEIRQVLSDAARQLYQEQGGATFRELAQLSCVGFSAANTTVKNMRTAGELRPVGTVNVPGSKRPMVRYAPANDSAWITQPLGLGDVMSRWKV